MGDHMILNEEQKKVVQSTEHFLFLLAGAGSGKTRVIVEKIKKLIDESIDPKDILAITFTRKSANEMRERVNNHDVHIHTFHQFCLEQLRLNEHYTYKIINEESVPFHQDERLKISIYKNSLYRTIKPKIYDKYQTYLKDNNIKDFDDMLLDFILLVQTKKYKPCFKYIFIDEFQDTNLLQYEVLKKLIHKDTHVLAVGDPDQSIYQFRGAHSKIISLYIEEYKAKTYMLSTNYRSTPEIIKLANAIITKNNRKFKKILITKHQPHITPKIIRHMNETDESHFIINSIKDLHKQGVKLHQIAILFRNHYRSYELKYQLDILDFLYQHESNQLQNQGIHLLSIHQAKGLEFDVVFIIGLEKYVLPSVHEHTQTEQDEERRLMFVAVTRAKKQLILSYVQYNSFNILQRPSIFIKECGLKIQKNK
ncbi:MAG: ATP-dependent helicase [Bacillota bacterium]|nr:MAG: ATP-dependent helicase [Bacillota bacterium]